MVKSITMVPLITLEMAFCTVDRMSFTMNGEIDHAFFNIPGVMRFERTVCDTVSYRASFVLSGRRNSFKCHPTPPHASDIRHEKQPMSHIFFLFPNPDRKFILSTYDTLS